MDEEYTKPKLLDEINDLRRTLDATTDGIWIWNLKTNQMHFNARYYQMLGYENEEFPASLDIWQSLLHPDDVDTSIRIAGDYLSNKFLEITNKFRLRTKDGAYKWIKARTRVVERDEQGYPVVLIGNHEDITEQVETEASLNKSYQSLTSVMESIDAHVYVADLENFEILFMNEKMRRDFGSDFTGQICHQVFRREDFPCETCTNPLLVNKQGEPAGPQIWEGQNVITGRYYLNHDRAIRWYDGRLVRIQVATDITERKQKEQAHLDEEARYRALFTESPIVLWEEDFSEVKNFIDELRIQGVNDWQKFFRENEQAVEECLKRVKILNTNMAALDFYEAGSIEDLMKGVSSLFTQGSFEVFRNELAAFAEGHTNFESEVQTVTFTGKPRYMLMRVTIPKGFEETWGKVFVSALDISARIEAEEILKRRTDEMATLHAISLDITTPVELNPILESIVAKATELLDGKSGLLSLCDAHKREVRCAVSYQTAEDFTGIVVNYGEDAAGIVAESGQPLVIDDYRNWDGRISQLESKESFQAILLVPIVWQNDNLGILVVQRNAEDRKFTQEDIDLLMTLANHAAIALENARLLQQVQRHADELEDRVFERTQELRTMVNAMSGREVRMAELKKVIQKLRRQIESADMTPIADDPLNEPLG